jgi:death-on-curing protein
MPEPVWIDLEVVLAIHDEQLAEHGGQPGVRDRGLLESALARPRNQFSYGEASIARLAASYAFGLSRNHPFVDGNKRTSLVVVELFLELNGSDLTATDAQCVTTLLALAAGELTEDQLAEWLTANTTVPR